MGRANYIYGRHPVSEALRTRPQDIQRLFLASAGQADRMRDLEDLARRNNVPVEVVSKRKLEDMVGAVPHQGVVAAAAGFKYVELEDLLARANQAGEAPLLLALDQIQDPQNLGALIRSCHALGGHGLFFPKDRAAEVTPLVVKASAGAASHLPIAQVTNLTRALEELKAAGVWAIGAAAEGTDRLDSIDLTIPTVIVIGSEGSGLRRLVAETCDRLVQIPMTGNLGSLNASVAGALFLYEAMRQRHSSPA